MSFGDVVGQVIDGKYSIESQLGKGGMGTVYLATHIGTGRPVAVKIIAPEFMQREEFVERFRREAKAAGRLRHPNVVDVTDFGFSKMENGEDAAYLVMEYLDGCTLGEVLDEEKQLPLEFSIDIIEQVCSAVEEAHKQGIIHRDLKPDNIWLEPNQRGGHTVKVLDFGIAKLEEASFGEVGDQIPYEASTKTESIEGTKTVVDSEQTETRIDKNASTVVAESKTVALQDESSTLGSEAGTIIQAEASIPKEVSQEDGTAILPSNETQELASPDPAGTNVIEKQSETSEDKAKQTAALTKVGAVLGTPLYMSPEQCRGEKLTQRSDIYSLAVIVYQMLSGKTPFGGDYLKVMEGHKTQEPPPLNKKKIPKKLKGIVMQSLAKDVEDRPETAEAFASKLRANSEGIGKLLRRTLVIYSHNLPKFLQLTILTFLPLLILSLIKAGFGLAVGFEFILETALTTSIAVGLEVLGFFVSIVTSAFLVGMMTWVVAQYLAFPLRDISLSSAFTEVKKRARSLSLTVGLSTVLAFIGFLFCFLPGLWLSARFMLIAPSIMMEGVSGKTAFRRSIELGKRSFRTVFATALLVYVIPIIFGFSLGIFIAMANMTYTNSLRVDKMKDEMVTMKKEGVKADPSYGQENDEENEKKKEGNGIEVKVNNTNIQIGSDTREKDEDEIDEIKKKSQKFVAISNALSQIVLLPIILLLASFTSVITALLYFKTRQAGGESMEGLLGKLDDADRPQSKWQQRVRERLIQSGKITGSPSKS